MGKNCDPVKNLVSIVTPVYNGEAHLARFLDSVLVQSWDHIEMILTDDGSEDGTLEAAEAYRNAFARRGFGYQIVTGRHRNASAAINRGLLQVRGEFLIWPDSDDVLEQDSVCRRVEFLQRNPQYQCVRSLGRYVDEAGEPARADEKQGNLEEEHLFFPVLESRTFVCCGCYMLRTEPFFAIYPKRKIPEYDVGQNFQMLLPFLYTHRCPTLTEELYTVYIRPGSHSRRMLTRQEEEKKYADYERLIDEIAELCNITNRDEKRRLTLWKQRRRLALSRKYGRKGRAAAALFRIGMCRGLSFRECLRTLDYIICGCCISRLYHWLQRTQ
ncbi:glycosyltransferase family 2 protein [bacterium 1XD42-94]|jgi:glycosyltransferase involved in cell wall biosynthesis|nr:glycosyltransferase family 2 protein [bacterium 1XD42-76]NBK06562.1 glycosyltransferase family 2 protein [bacterium 1XD42-94]